MKIDPFSLHAQQTILKLASWHMADVLGASVTDPPPTTDLAELKVAGIFVTLKKNGELRACMGNLGGHSPLDEALRNAARAVVTRDTRFPPFMIDELRHLEVDVTLLHDDEPVAGPAVDRANSIVVGEHGLLIRCQGRSGLLLPQVPVEHHWDATTFLNQVCLKAGLPRETWRSEMAQVDRFRGKVIPGHFCNDILKAGHATSTYRPSTVSGTFYPLEARTIQAEARSLLRPHQQQPAKGLMVPHAGWVYSGQIAAEVFSRTLIPPKVIVIGPKHTAAGANWTVMPDDFWQWPGGRLASPRALADRIVESIPGVVYDSLAHEKEHCIEVELPLLAEVRPDVEVLGLLIGRADFDDCMTLASGLTAVLRQEGTLPLIVTSSDMNHFASDKENRILDRIALDALETLDPERLYRTVVEEYAISMCGVRPAVVMLAVLRELVGLKHFEQVGYTTSADVSGDPTRVVGYAGYRFW